MGYFSNGCEGYDYQERYCAKCVHHPQTDDAPACPVWASHYIFNYDACDNEKLRAVLNALIPIKDKIHNDQCKMFVPLNIVKKKAEKEPTLW